MTSNDLCSPMLQDPPPTPSTSMSTQHGSQCEIRTLQNQPKLDVLTLLPEKETGVKMSSKHWFVIDIMG